jgi:hypothetical protein
VPSGTVAKGAPQSGGTNYLQLTYSNVPAGTYTVKCFADEYGETWAGPMTLSGSGTVDVPCRIVWRKGWVYVEVVGQLTTPKTYIP